MSLWVLVLFLNGAGRAGSVAIDMPTKEICLREAAKVRADFDTIVWGSHPMCIYRGAE